MKQETERNTAIYEEHLNGAKFKDLAKKYNISDSRVKNIFYTEKARRKEEKPKIFDLLESLCTDEQLVRKTMTVLKRIGATSEASILALDKKTLKKTWNCGEKMQELILDMQESIRHKKYIL